MTTKLKATTVALDGPIDLLAEAGDDGYLWRDETGGLAGQGVAVVIPLALDDPVSVAQVTDLLGAIETQDDVRRPGTGPIALGALPFDPASPGHLVVPRRVIGTSDGIAWITTIEGAGQPEFGRPTPSEGGEPPDQFDLSASMSHSDWRETVSDAVEVIRRGDLHKVVLARRIDITANRPFVVSDVLERLGALYPSCMIFSVDGFIGASPELLLRRDGDRIESHPLAGTVARSGDGQGDEALVARLMASPKARHEHRVVVESILEVLEPLCERIEAPATPSILGLRNVSHLATHITGQLHSADRLPSAIELVALLQPTPAVGGSPVAAAVQYLQKVEGFDRRSYAGPVGWVDARGDGVWAIGIRCAEVDGPRASIYAGNGIVAGSDPDEELAETQLKLQALLAALVRP